jgi:hypothetical protein
VLTRELTTLVCTGTFGLGAGIFGTGGLAFTTGAGALGLIGVWVRRKTAGAVFGFATTLLVTTDERAGTTATAEAQIVTLDPFT